MIVISEEKIKVVDMLMGTGKTCAAINMINDQRKKVIREHSCFLYITPYLDEVSRIKQACPSMNFVEPKNINGSKLSNFKNQLRNGYNIVSTHSLFQRIDKEAIEILREKGYTLIIDEVTEVIRTYEMDPDDVNLMKELFVYSDEEDFLHWRVELSKYDGKIVIEEKKLCEMNCLAQYNEKYIMCLFPIEAFKSFRHIYVLTYMFDAQWQRCYFDYYNMPYEYIYVTGDSPENYCFTEDKEKVVQIDKDFKSLIHIVRNDRMNTIGNDKGSLSKNWYEKKATEADLKQLKNNLSNYFRRIRNTKSSDCMWTTFKEYKKYLKGKGYSKGFLACNVRASNAYQDRTSVAYAINKYSDPNIKNFFAAHGVCIDEDKYALSEMLQFIWRSAIRNGQEISIYIPSDRMRNLLEDWIARN